MSETSGESKKKGLSGAQRILVIGGVLVALEAVFLFVIMDREEQETLQDRIQKTLEQQSNLSPSDRSFVKVKLAIREFKQANQTYPETLAELVPQFLPRIPLDPSTGSPFEYTLVNGNPKLSGGTRDDKDSAAATSSGQIKADQMIKESEEDPFLNLLNKDIENSTFVYDSTGKKDPFRSFDFSPKQTAAVGDSPLEKASYESLRYVAFLKGFGVPKGIVEDTDGKGHTVTVGTKIGNLGGKIMKVDPDSLTILETTIDFTGEKRTRTIQMLLK